MNRMQTDKQTPVSLPEIYAAREELMQTFGKAAQNQYIYVQAPAGYGKTISTLLWIKKAGCKTIWISLDAYDNTPVLFYRLFCTSVLSVMTNGADFLQDVKSPAFKSSPVESAIELLSRLSFEDCPYALVFDDFHLITNEEIKKSLPFVLKRLPVSVPAFILSRSGPPDSFAALIEQNKLSRIGSLELAFSSEEIRKHFSSYGRFITKEEAEQLRDFTEGWIIALNIMVISGNIDTSYKSHSQSINSFIEQHIWNKFDKTLQEFLMKTALPDKFSAELCERLTGSDHCKETLDYLVGGNINISLVGGEYRYHNLFLEFLREKLNQSDVDIKALNKMVAEYYLQTGNYLDAKNYAMKSGDANAISQTIRSFYSLTTFSLDEYTEFHKLYNLHALPDAICDKAPLLYAARIFFYYTNGDFNEVSRLFDKLYPLLPVIASLYPNSMENIRSMILLDCRHKLAEIASHASIVPSDQLSHANLQSPTFTFQLPFLHRCARDFYQAADPEIDHNIRMFSKNIIKQNVDVMFDGAQAGLLMEKNKLREGLEIAVSMKGAINESLSPEFVYAVYVLTAEIYLLLDQRDKYEENIKEVKKYIATNSCQYLLKNFSAYEARTAIQDGNKKAAEKWLANYYVGDASFSEFYKIYRNFTTVRANILLSQTDKAFPALHKLRTLAQSYDRPLDEAEADVLLAIADWISGNKKEAQSRLLHALSSMQKFGFVRVIANEGKAVLPILSSIIRKMEKNDEISGELYRFTKDVYFTAYEQSKRFKGITHHAEPMPVKLSPRQKRVLELLAQGRKNAEIIEIMGLSLNTIRTHTRIIYQKLEVNNVTDAVVKARELGLIGNHTGS